MSVYIKNNINSIYVSLLVIIIYNQCFKKKKK